MKDERRKRNRIKVEETLGKEELLMVYGKEVKDVRCKCGRKLCEVEEPGSGVIRMKCRHCQRIVRIRLTNDFVTNDE